MAKPEAKPKKGLTALDRARAIDINDTDLYVVNHREKFTDKIMAIERFMVIRAKNGRKYIFREYIKTDKKANLLGPDGKAI